MHQCLSSSIWCITSKLCFIHGVHEVPEKINCSFECLNTAVTVLINFYIDSLEANHIKRMDKFFSNASKMLADFSICIVLTLRLAGSADLYSSFVCNCPEP